MVALVEMVLSACAAQPAVYPPATFAHRVATQDVEIYWNCTKAESGLLQVDGVARNIGGRDVRFLNLEVESVNVRESRLLSAAAPLQALVLPINQLSPFQLQLPTRGDEARYDLFYQYRVPSRLGALDPDAGERRFMARDVCSDTQNRSR